MNLEAESGTPNSAASVPEPDLALEAISEDLVLALLKNREFPTEEIQRLARNAAVMKLRKARVAIAAHPRAPRRIALRLVRELYTFDLMQFALMPAVPSDLRRLADELLVARLASLAFGEKISLARRCSARVAGALLLDKESRVWQTALLNPRLTEAALTAALHRSAASAGLVEAVCRHSKWCLRQEVRVALLRNPHTPLARAIEFARRIPPALLRDILHGSQISGKVRTYLLHDLQRRTKKD